MGTRSLALLVVLLLLPGLVHAQLRFGAAVEANRMSFGGVPPDNAEFSTNYGTGVSGILEYRVHHDVVMSFQPGWIQKGSVVEFNKRERPDSVETFTVEQSWVTLPVYFCIDGDNSGVYAGGGLSVDFILDSSVEHEGTETDNQDAFTDIDATYQFTAGYMYKRESFAMFLEARYVQGLLVIKNADKSTVGDVYVSDIKSDGLRLVLGILF